MDAIVERHAFGFHLRHAAVDDVLFHLEVGNAVTKQPAGIAWHQMPTFLGLLNLEALRDGLRKHNLHGTEDIPVTNPAGGTAPPQPPTADDLSFRNFSGCHNDLRPGKAEMGSASSNSANPAVPADFDRSNPGARFGRNGPARPRTPTRLVCSNPAPREISRHLLARVASERRSSISSRPPGFNFRRTIGSSTGIR